MVKKQRKPGLRLLVTGGAGFIGSNFIRHFLRRNPHARIVNLDKLTYAGNLDNLAEVRSHRNYQFVRGDICNRALVRGLFSEPFDAVVHFAAESHVDRSIMGGQEFARTNVLGTYTLLDAARRSGVKRFLHVSTDEVYGSLAPGEMAREDAPPRPRSPYAASKAGSDLMALSFFETYRFPVIITRSTNNYGPFQFPEKLIPLMITNALEGKRLPVYGDGLNERDWLYVDDHCAALDRILQAGEAGQIYNISAGQPVTNLEIVRSLLKLLGKTEELIEYVQDRPGHDRRYALNTEKIRCQLGWQPAIRLEQGLARTVEWYRTHTDWVRKTKSGEYRSYYKKLYERRRATLARL